MLTKAFWFDYHVNGKAQVKDVLVFLAGHDGPGNLSQEDRDDQDDVCFFSPRENER